MNEAIRGTCRDRPRITRATVLDAPDISTILLAAFLPFEPQYTPQGFRATTLSTNEAATRMLEGPSWIARSDGMAVGTVSAVARGQDVHIRSMAVLPYAQGNGCATALLNAATAFATGLGAHRLTLTTTPFLSAAIRLYERVGFVRLQEPLDLHGTPLFLMVRTLPVDH